MTVLDDRQLVDWGGASARPSVAGSRERLRSGARPVRRRAASTRPAVAPLQYRGSGVQMSQVSHNRRPVSTSLSIVLAGLAALITLWLGVLGNFSGNRAAASAQLSDQLAVVQVQSGETLQQLAARIAPTAPAGQVVQRIRELNQLDSSSVDAGQTLIAPVG